MGLTGAYGNYKNRLFIIWQKAGQLFGLLIGFGSALFKKTLIDGP